MYRFPLSHACTALWLLCTALSAKAAPRETITFESVNSAGAYQSATNALRTWSPIGAYPVGQLELRGTLRKLDPFTFSLEAAIEITTPSGETLLVHPCPGGEFSTTISGAATHSLCTVPSAAGLWTFRFFEEYDDSGATDSVWDSITFTLLDDGPTPLHPESLGTIGDSLITRDQTLNASEVRWYQVVIPFDVRVANQRSLRIDTLGSHFSDFGGLNYPDDTCLNLFDTNGALVASNEDFDFNADDFTAVLSFGMPGTGRQTGADGDLPAGTYLLAASTTCFHTNCFYVEPYTVQPGQLHLTLTSATHFCAADFNQDQIVDLFDYLDFVQAFATGAALADFNGDGGIDIFDYLDFLQAFAAGC